VSVEEWQRNIKAIALNPVSHEANQSRSPCARRTGDSGDPMESPCNRVAL
jgi:hypothetical protein